jgi:predicted nucleotidyltransferase
VNPLIEHHREAILALCRTYGIRRLDLFGSAATSDFDPERSDVDFIVEYPPDYDFGPWLARYFEFEERLESLLGRPVDLVMPSALRNRWFNREVAKTRTVLYDASEISEVA